MLSILLLSFIIAIANAGSCGRIKFQNFLGRYYTVDSSRYCKGKEYTWPKKWCRGYYKCRLKNSIWTEAIKSSYFDFSDPKCNWNVKTSSGTDDKSCSTPTKMLGDPYAKLFKPVCLTHDMCLKIKGNTDDECDDHFGFNNRQICKAQFPDYDKWPGSATLFGLCIASAKAYELATKVPVFGSDSYSKIDPVYCQKGRAPTSRPTGRPTYRITRRPTARRYFSKQINYNKFKKNRVVHKSYSDFNDEIQVLDDKHINRVLIKVYGLISIILVCLIVCIGYCIKICIKKLNKKKINTHRYEKVDITTADDTTDASECVNDESNVLIEQNN